MDKTGKARKSLKKIMPSEYHKYIEEQLAGDFAHELMKTIGLLRKSLAVADRRAGFAERMLEDAQDTNNRHKGWLRKAKADAGYRDSISFDAIWILALAALKEKKS